MEWLQKSEGHSDLCTNLQRLYVAETCSSLDDKCFSNSSRITTTTCRCFVKSRVRSPSSPFILQLPMSLKRLLLVPYLLAYAVRSLSTPCLGGGGTPTMTFEVVQYNLFGRPALVFKDGQSERLQRIPEALVNHSKTIDVFTLAEGFDSSRDDMLAQFRKLGFEHSTSILDGPAATNGGVIIVSKWPILKEAQHLYGTTCHGTDCLAAKGVKYARVLKSVNGVSKIFNVFATHLQMRKFIDAVGIPAHEPLILAGDFNVDNQTFRDEVTNLELTLKAHEPLRIGNQRYTSDPHTNVLVGRDGAAGDNKCKAQYESNWGPLQVGVAGVYTPSLNTRTTCSKQDGGDNKCYCPCCPFEWLDYVLYAQAPYQQPSTVPTLEALVNQVSLFKADWSDENGPAKMAMRDLSDHYPVLGKLTFPLTRGKGMDNDPSSYNLDGCSTDSDCHLGDSGCLCKGAQCYYKGNYTDGSKLDKDHPVNRNCAFELDRAKCICGPK
ncbi:hypothetical protein PsorP6_014623 [Peronosclerospora sorghi]|uniref:Uncharacterized protein n=1 Tax=Peronosclerospora sorghi TaxID=230839 RepID=A0ACC0VUZ0_9STRA|nr:hypothetical protein PsorP6_014623 [Peronosclerospora sorghi]